MNKVHAIIYGLLLLYIIFLKECKVSKPCEPCDEAGYILGNLLANIPDSVWDELKTSHTTASSYGKIVQDLETLAKQIKALTAANL